MTGIARAYTDNTKKKLFALSGNLCAFPNCRERIVKDTDIFDLLVQICHIEAAEVGGQRYNPNMSDDERRGFDNLILFCPNHHTETNDEKKYTVAVLREMKMNHQSLMLQQKIQQKPNLLAEVISAISAIVIDNDTQLEPQANSFDIENKITFNNLIKYKPIIEEYKVLHSKIDSLYQEIEKQGSFKKSKLLRNIKLIYLKVKGEVITGANNEIEQIRKNADFIFSRIEEELTKSVDENIGNIVYSEDIIYGIAVIMVDAFMRCKILEEPTKV